MKNFKTDPLSVSSLDYFVYATVQLQHQRFEPCVAWFPARPRAILNSTYNFETFTNFERQRISRRAVYQSSPGFSADDIPKVRIKAPTTTGWGIAWEPLKLESKLKSRILGYHVYGEWEYTPFLPPENNLGIRFKYSPTTLPNNQGYLPVTLWRCYIGIWWGWGQRRLWAGYVHAFSSF